MDYEKMNKNELISVLKEKDKKIRKLQYYAYVDSLTNILNRRAGFKILQRNLERSRKNKSNMSICFLDIDGFKSINDRFGHQEGDRVLITISQIIKENIRNTDIVFRSGGDEFIIIFPDTSIEIAKLIWDRVYNKIVELSISDLNDYRISVSFGFSEASPHKKPCIKDLIREADRKMYIRSEA